MSSLVQTLAGGINSVGIQIGLINRSRLRQREASVDAVTQMLFLNEAAIKAVAVIKPILVCCRSALI